MSLDVLHATCQRTCRHTSALFDAAAAAAAADVAFKTLALHAYCIAACCQSITYIANLVSTVSTMFSAFRHSSVKFRHTDAKHHDLYSLLTESIGWVSFEERPEQTLCLGTEELRHAEFRPDNTVRNNMCNVHHSTSAYLHVHCTCTPIHVNLHHKNYVN